MFSRSLSRTVVANFMQNPWKYEPDMHILTRGIVSLSTALISFTYKLSSPIHSMVVTFICLRDFIAGSKRSEMPAVMIEYVKETMSINVSI